MASEHASAGGSGSVPHVKTHKTLEIARKQLAAAGAVGITVATIGEAEVFAADGVKDIFIAYPLWVEAPHAQRLRALAAQCRLAGRRGLRWRVRRRWVADSARTPEALRY